MARLGCSSVSCAASSIIAEERHGRKPRGVVAAMNIVPRSTNTHPHRPDRGAHLGYDPIPMTSCKSSPYPPGCSTSARGTTTPLSFQEGYHWGPFPAGGSRYTFFVPPDRHFCGLLIRDCTVQ